MSLLASFLVGGEVKFTRNDFILLNLSQVMSVPNNVSVASSPFELDDVVDGTLEGWNDTTFEFTVPKDAIYAMQAAYRTASPEPITPVGNRCAEIVVDGTTLTTGSMAELKIVPSNTTGFYAINSNAFLVAGQKVKFGVRQTSGVAQDYSIAGTYAYIFKNGVVL